MKGRLLDKSITMSLPTDISQLRHGTELLKRGFARMQKGGVIMDVVTPEQAASPEFVRGVSCPYCIE